MDNFQTHRSLMKYIEAYKKAHKCFCAALCFLGSLFFIKCCIKIEELFLHLPVRRSNERISPLKRLCVFGRHAKISWKPQNPEMSQNNWIGRLWVMWKQQSDFSAGRYPDNSVCVMSLDKMSAVYYFTMTHATLNKPALLQLLWSAAPNDGCRTGKPQTNKILRRHDSFEALIIK